MWRSIQRYVSDMKAFLLVLDGKIAVLKLLASGQRNTLQHMYVRELKSDEAITV